MSTEHTAAAPGPDERSEGGPSYVHPEETGSEFQNNNGYREFLVAGMRPLVEFYGRLYETIDLRDHKNRQLSYHGCRNVAWFVRHVRSQEVRVASRRCNLRWCPLCIKTKRFIMKSSIIPWIEKRQKPKFITLTLRHSDDPLSDQLERIYECFKKLRSSELWKNHIQGGMWFFQVTKTKETNQWHPHLHIICAGKYLEQSALREKWYKITHDSNIVDIRAIKSAVKTADYVARYATAPADLSKMVIEDAIEVFDALAGRKMCGTFGTGKEIQLVPKQCPDADDWEDIGSFWQITNKRWCDNHAAAIYYCWTTRTPCRLDLTPPEPAPPEERDYLEYEPVTYQQQQMEWSDFYRKVPGDDVPF